MGEESQQGRAKVGMERLLAMFGVAIITGIYLLCGHVAKHTTKIG